MNETITVRIPRKLQSEITRLSREERVSVSNLVRESLSRYVALKMFRRLRAKAIPHARKRGIFTDEDVFKLVS